MKQSDLQLFSKQLPKKKNFTSTFVTTNKTQLLDIEQIMPSFAESNINNGSTLIIQAHCASFELVHIARHTLPSPRPKILTIACLLITSENETPYVHTQVVIDIGYSTLRFQPLSSTNEPLDQFLEQNIDELIRNQMQTNRENESSSGDV